MTRRILVALLASFSCLLSACAAPKSALVSSPPYPWFNFKWASATLSERSFDKVAIVVPVRVGDLGGNFTAQFDLGSESTFLYEDAIKNYFASRAQLYAQVDTARRGTTDAGNRHYGTTGLPFAFGGSVIPHPRLMTKMGDVVPRDSLRTASDKLIGTIGADFLKGKVLVIDYPQHRMCVLDSVDAFWRARAVFVAVRLRRNQFHIPIAVRGQAYWALFDTGSSLFPFVTDRDTWQTLVGPAAPADTLSVNSWGTQVPYYGSFMRHDAYLGSRQLPKARAWFTQNKRMLDFFKAEHIDAITGNAFFFDNTVVLDFQHNQFGVVK